MPIFRHYLDRELRSGLPQTGHGARGPPAGSTAAPGRHRRLVFGGEVSHLDNAGADIAVPSAEEEPERVGPDRRRRTQEDYVSSPPVVLAPICWRGVPRVAQCLVVVRRDHELARPALNDLGRLVLVQYNVTSCIVSIRNPTWRGCGVKMKKIAGLQLTQKIARLQFYLFLVGAKRLHPRPDAVRTRDTAGPIRLGENPLCHVGGVRDAKPAPRPLSPRLAVDAVRFLACRFDEAAAVPMPRVGSARDPSPAFGYGRGLRPAQVHGAFARAGCSAWSARPSLGSTFCGKNVVSAGSESVQNKKIPSQVSSKESI